MQVSRDFEKLLKDLQESDSSDETLRGLSNLLAEERQRLSEMWHSIAVEQRRATVKRLIEIAEVDIETDFTQVFTMCLKDADPQVRASAIDGLWENEDVMLIRPLVDLLGGDDSALVQEASATSLSRFALLAELGRLQPRLADMVWEALWQAVHDPRKDLDVRRRAVESLAYFSRKEVREVIERAYQDDEDRVRISAVFAMGCSADEGWGDVIIKELETEDPEMRYEAVRASGALRIAEAVPMLARMVVDPDPEVKLMAIWSLGQIGGPEARRVLQICYEQGDEALQDAAQEALAEMDFMQGSLDFTMYDFGMDASDEDESPEEDGDWDDWASLR
jgi:HEAT repeat protein